MLGGYLRYLYDTTTRRKTLEADYDKLTSLLQKKKKEHEGEKTKEHEGEKPPLQVTPFSFQGTIEITPNIDEKNFLDQMKERRRFSLLNTLERIALIFLSPILAMAVWLVLEQLGIQGQQQNVQGQTGIFVLAAVSFAIGLITNEAVQFLTNFGKQNTGQNQNQSTTGQNTGQNQNQSTTGQNSGTNTPPQHSSS